MGPCGGKSRSRLKSGRQGQSELNSPSLLQKRSDAGWLGAWPPSGLHRESAAPEARHRVPSPAAPATPPHDGVGRGGHHTASGARGRHVVRTTSLSCARWLGRPKSPALTVGRGAVRLEGCGVAPSPEAQRRPQWPITLAALSVGNRRLHSPDLWLSTTLPRRQRNPAEANTNQCHHCRMYGRRCNTPSEGLWRTRLQL